MGENSKISWTNHTFTPWWGCTPASAGCAHCYAAACAKRSEREHAAALIVRVCQHRGDQWQAVSPQQVGEVLRADVDSGRQPFASLLANPFFRPDVNDLVAHGFATMREGGAVELTEAGLAAIAKWARAGEGGGA